MAQREAIYRHHLIIKKLQRQPCSFDELADYLQEESRLQEYDLDITIRTFQRDVKDISSIYDIDIAYDRSLKKYRIVDEGSAAFNDRLFEAFDTLNALNTTGNIAEHLHFQQRKPIGTEHFNRLLHAIKRNQNITFHHYKYYGATATARTVSPYGLKEYRNRWYLVGKDHKDEAIKTFGIDRMERLKLIETTFEKPSNFKLETYFQYSWGVIVGSTERPEPVELRFTPFQGNYIKSLPLHPSQEILIDNDKEVRVQVCVHPTHDFMMEILSMTPEVTVLKPAFLVQEIQRKLREGLGIYQP